MINLNEFQTLFLYFAIFFSSIVIATKYQKNLLNQLKHSDNKNNVLAIIVIALPVFIASVRYAVGTDFFNYEYDYLSYSNYSIKDLTNFKSEPFFGALSKIASLVFGNVWGLFFLSSFITLYLILKGLEYYKYDINIPFSLFIYYFVFYGLSLNIVRQMIATSIVFYCYRFVIEKKIFKYIIGILIASQFHITALFFFPIYFLKDSIGKGYKFKRIIYYLMISFSPIFVYITTKFMFSLNISKFTNIYSIDFSEGGAGFLIWVLPVLIPIFAYKKTVLTMNPKYSPLFSIFLLQIPLSYLGYYSMHASRMAYYSSVVEIILVPLVIRSVPKKYNKLMLSIYFIAWYIFRFINTFYINKGAEIIPYKFIF